ncbi:hypothetical protein [Rhizobium leguminosarum]|uniref:hypothetical protein n=1 Tax=Rhizobium leguminosarum TaxID=384 RepID=UPI001C9503DB|nr:hypothetical protein [Rhizobium leguminosarum]MBY5580246.1 hypothetical protein [Rhizobium leguminosarum]
MSVIQKLFHRNLLTRFVAGLGAVPQRIRDAREERKPAIHPSFMDDFGAWSDNRRVYGSSAPAMTSSNVISVDI